MRAAARTGLCRGLALAALGLLGACASKPAPPDWQMNAKSSLERATAAYLSGNSALEALEFARARADLARTGQPALVARAELLRCATRVASLVFEPCSGFDALAADASPADQAYARYLAGAAQPADLPLLPAAQQAAAAGPANAAALAALTDPLSALVASGVMARRSLATGAVAQVASDAASAQGWRRPLLAWLALQQQQARAEGRQEDAERLARRIALVLGSGKGLSAQP